MPENISALIKHALALPNGSWEQYQSFAAIGQLVAFYDVRKSPSKTLERFEKAPSRTLEHFEKSPSKTLEL